MVTKYLLCGWHVLILCVESQSQNLPQRVDLRISIH